MGIAQRAGLVLLTAAIAACSGGGDGSGLAPTAAPGAPVGGVPVKGPLANAMLEGFELDPAAENGEGALADTGFTNAQAQIQDFNLTSGRDYVVQVSLTADTEDLSTGAAPLLSPLRGIITSEQILAGADVYPSPATTALIALADALGDINAANLTEARDRLLAVILPGILPADVDLFGLAPIVTNDAGQVIGKESTIVSFRMFSEAIVALLQEMADSDAGIADVNAAFAVFIADLADDGELQSAQGLGVSTQDPSTIPLPGRPGETLADVAALMASERNDTGMTGLEVTLPQPQPEAGVTSRPDNDADGVPNHRDNCIDTANSDQANFDEDSKGDVCDSDDDNDGLADTAEISTNPKDPDSDDDGALDGADNCPLTGPNDQTDTDSDGAGNVCDDDDDNDGSSDTEEAQRGTNPLVADTDSDGVDDPTDNCPLTGPNDQTDTDNDGAGDVCDTDDDNDGLSDAEEQSIGTDPLVADTDNDSVNDGQDNCPLLSHPDQTDTDQDGAGDVCDNDDDNDGLNDADETVTNPKDPDTDDDGALDGADNCPLTGPNDQTDTDGDGAGNVCDADDDNDGLNDDDETNSDPLNPDTDEDTVGDAEDNCPRTPNVDQGNADGDANGDACDDDDDNDGLSDAEEQQLGTNPLNGDTDNDTVGDADDNCPVDANTEQADFDTDGQGDVCDADDDNDGSPDEEESSRGTNPKDADSDDDGANDGADNCPLTGPNDQGDNDGDGQGDICDTDDDNDSVEDSIDNCPFTANQPQSNFDGDDQGDACDADRDNDGLNDEVDECPVTPVDQRESINGQGCGPDEVDTDNDGFFDPEDNCPAVANPDQSNNDGDAQGDVCDNDDDNDGVDDGVDNCPLTENSDQLNSDGDTQGNVCDDDDDNDNVADAADNCPLASNESQADQDGDNVGDACDEDVDGDGLDGAAEQERGTDPNKADTDGDGSDDGVDNCPINSNPNQVDTDQDGEGNLCDPDDDNDGLSDIEEAEQGSDPFKADTDGDGHGDASDNCPADANADQADFDNDQRGDVCDTDDDNDGLSDVDEEAAGTNPKKADTDDDTVDDGNDNCPLTGPADQTDTDEDGKGDVCDDDIDGDTVENGADNCPNTGNTDQANFDGDSFGDACDNDIDGDGLEEPADICPNTPPEEHGDIDAQGCGPSELDTDDDGFSNADDNCPTVANADQSNIDGDAQGDACDDDKDGDNVDNEVDNCPTVSNEDQLNSDGFDDGGNACDDDDDNDERLDGADNCPLDHNTDQADQDADGIGDVCDPDRDGDGVDNDADNCPFTENEGQADADNDGEGDVCDNDRDNDGTDDTFDNCPNVANQNQSDTDGDGDGDACDSNDDGDAFDDAQDNCPLIENDEQNDFDGDNQGDVCDADDDNDGFDDGQDVCPFTPEGDAPDSVGCGPNDVPASGSGTFHSSELTRTLFGGNPSQRVEWGFYEAVDEEGFVTLTGGAGNQQKGLYNEPSSADSSERDARRDEATGALQRLGDINLNVDEQDLEREDAGLFVAQSHWMQPMPGRVLVGDRLSVYRPLGIDSVDTPEESRTLTPRFDGNSVNAGQWVLAPISSNVDRTVLPTRLGLVTVSINSGSHRFGLSEFNINSDGSANESSFRIRQFQDSGSCCGSASSPNDQLADGNNVGYRGQAVDVLFDVTDTGGATLRIFDGGQNKIDEKIGFIGASGASMLLRQTDADPLGHMGHSFGLPLPAADETPAIEGSMYRISGSVSGMNSIGVLVMRGMRLSLEAGGVARLSGETERNFLRTSSDFGLDSLEGFIYQQAISGPAESVEPIDVTGTWVVEAGGRIRIDFTDVLGEQVAADGFVNADGDALALAWMATLPNGGWSGHEPANASGLVLGSAAVLPQENVRPKVTEITTNGLGENFIAERGQTLPLMVSVDDADSDAVAVQWQTYFGSFTDREQASTTWLPEPNEDDNTLLIVGVDDGTDGSFGVVGVWGGELDREGTTTEQFRAADVFSNFEFDAGEIEEIFFWEPERAFTGPVGCDSGSGNAVFTDSNSDGIFNAGDVWDVSFNDCVFQEPDQVETLNGAFRITVESGIFEGEETSTVLIELFNLDETDEESEETFELVTNGAYRQTISELLNNANDDLVRTRTSIAVVNTFTADYREIPVDPDEDIDEGRVSFAPGCAAAFMIDYDVDEWSLDMDCNISLSDFGSSSANITARYQTGEDGVAVGGPISYWSDGPAFIIEDGAVLIDVSVYDGQPVSDFVLLAEFDDNGFLEYFAQIAGDEPYIIDVFEPGEVFDIADNGLDLWPLNPNLNGEVHRFAGIDLEFAVFPNLEEFGGTKQGTGIIFERGQFGLNVPAQEANFEFETLGGPILGRAVDPNNMFVFNEEHDIEEESLLDVLLAGPSVAFTGVGIEQDSESDFNKANLELDDDRFLGITSSSRRFNTINAAIGLARFGVETRDSVERVNPDDLFGEGAEAENSLGGRVVSNLSANQLPTGNVGIIYVFAEMEVQRFNQAYSRRELCAGIAQLSLDANSQFTQAERGREPCVIFEEDNNDGSSELEIDLPSGNNDIDARPNGGITIVDSENAVVELRTDFIDWEPEYGYSLVESEGGLFTAVADGELFLAANDESVAYMVPYSSGATLSDGSWRVSFSAMGMGENGFNTLFFMKAGVLSITSGVPTLQGTVTVANRDNERSPADIETIELNLTGTMSTGGLGEIIIEFPDEFITLTGFETVSGELALGKLMRYENGVDELALGLWNAIRPNSDSEAAAADQPPSIEVELLVGGVEQTPDQDGFYNLDSGAVVTINVTSADPDGDSISYRYRVTDGVLDQGVEAQDFNGETREDAGASQTWSVPASDGSALLLVEARAGLKAGSEVIPVRWRNAP